LVYVPAKPPHKNTRAHRWPQQSERIHDVSPYPSISIRPGGGVHGNLPGKDP
jgi:hypothetical protein